MQTHIICPICLKQFKELGYHIKKLHNLDLKEFKELYPGFPLISELQSHIKGKSISKSRKENPTVFTEELRLKLSIGNKRRHKKEKEENYDEYMSKQRKLAENMRNKKGEDYTHSEKTISKMKESAKTRPARPPHKDKAKKLIGDAQKKRPKWSHAQETKDNIKLGLARFKESAEYPQYIKNISRRNKERYLNNPESFLKFVKIKQERYTSSLEIKFKKFLVEKNIDFEHQWINDVWTYDFYLPLYNMLVETDGEYWHTKSLEQINKDILKHKNAIKKGFSICRISDKDWRPEKIFENKQLLEKDSLNIIHIRKQNFIKETS